MKTKLLIPIIATLCGPASFALAQDIDSAPPVVIKTIPEAGTKDVPPGEYEIQVTFSKDMADQSWSWSTAWENSTPEMVGKPHYTDDHRTCVLKVNLEPGKTYGWWLNSQKFHGFRDAQNHAAVPYLLTFTTGTTAAVATGNSSATATGWQLWQSHDYDGAAAKFREAVAVSPNDANAWNGLGWALFNGGKTDDAIEPFQKAVALQADHPAALNGLGQIYLSERKYDDAEKYLLKAAPRAPAAWYGLARLYLLEGKYADAEHWAQNIVDAGQADETVKKMLEAAQKKNVSEGLRFLIEPPAAESSGQSTMNSTNAAAFNPPKVILVSPADGATNVAAVQELRIRFDQPMKPDDLWLDWRSGGFFLDDLPRYNVAQNEFIVPVRMASGVTNQLSLNWINGGFCGVNSGPSDQFKWQFVTRPDAAKPDAAIPGIVSISPKRGEILPVLTLLEITFDRPMMPPDRSPPYLKRVGWGGMSLPALVPSFDYDPATHRFTVPVILMPDNETKLTLEGFRSADGVEAGPVVVSCETGTNNFSAAQLEEMVNTANDPRLHDLLLAMQAARARLNSGVETVQDIYVYGAAKSFHQNLMANGSLFKWQGTNRFYADISDIMNCPKFVLGVDGADCWSCENDKNNGVTLGSFHATSAADIQTGIADPFSLARHPVEFVITNDRLIYDGQTQLDGRACHHLHAWFVDQSADDPTGVSASKLEWWIDAKTLLPSRIICFSGDGTQMFNFHFDKLNQPMAASEFQPPPESPGAKMFEIFKQSPGPDEKNFIKISDGSTGNMSDRIGRRGPNGTTSSGLN